MKRTSFLSFLSSPEYDPNPLLSLGKRKGRASGPSTVPAQTTGSIFNSLNEPTTSSDLTSRLERAAEKWVERMMSSLIFVLMSPSVVVFQGTSSIEENEEALDEETTAAALLLPPAAH